MLTTTAMRCGFSGGLVVDYPNSTKAKKYYLVLSAGTPGTAGRIVRRKGRADRRGGAGAGAGAAAAMGGGGGPSAMDGSEGGEGEESDLALGVGIGEGGGEMDRAMRHGGRAGAGAGEGDGWGAVGAGVRVIHRRSGEAGHRGAGAEDVSGPKRKKKGGKWKRPDLVTTRRDMIMQLKDKARGKGKSVTKDSKYSGRKRRDRF